MNAPTEYRRGAPALGAEIFCHAQATEQRCRVMRTGFFCPWSFCGRPRGERRYVKRGMIHFDNPAVDDFVAVRASRGHKDQQLEPDRREALQSKADANHGFQQIAIRPLPCFGSRGIESCSTLLKCELAGESTAMPNALRRHQRMFGSQCQSAQGN